MITLPMLIFMFFGFNAGVVFMDTKAKIEAKDKIVSECSKKIGEK